MGIYGKLMYIFEGTFYNFKININIHFLLILEYNYWLSLNHCKYYDIKYDCNLGLKSGWLVSVNGIHFPFQIMYKSSVFNEIKRNSSLNREIHLGEQIIFIANNVFYYSILA